jgi:hypothetical protein
LKVSVRHRVFRLLHDRPLDLSAPSSIWNATNRDGRLPDWGSESAIQRRVGTVLEDALKAGGLEDMMNIHDETSLGDEWPNFFVVRSAMGMPIGVIEIKKPDAKIMRNRLIYGQIFDYMMMLRAFHGLTFVFGIVTTYEQWRICWLEDTDALAMSDGAEPVSQVPTGHAEREVEVFDDDDDGKPVVGKLHAGDVLRFDNADLPRVIVSVLCKMHSSQLHGFLPQGKRPRLRMGPKGWVYRSAKHIVEDIGGLPHANTKHFYMLQDFGLGGDGHVWRACDKRGAVCVLKFARKYPDESAEVRRKLLAAECHRWQRLWGRRVARVVKLNRDFALLMPFARPTPEAKEITRKSGRLPDNVLGALRKMAESGLYHEDLRWRHVGLIERGRRALRSREGERSRRSGCGCGRGSHDQDAVGRGDE